MNISKIIDSKHRTDWTDAIWKEIVQYLSDSKSKKEFGKILNGLLSESEKQTIVNRVTVLALIKDGESYSEIGEKLWVSPVTISTTKKNFWNKSGHYKSYRSVPKKERKRGEGFKAETTRFSWNPLDGLLGDTDFLEFIKNPPRPKGIGLKQKF